MASRTTFAATAISGKTKKASAYVSIRQHTSAYGQPHHIRGNSNIRKNTKALAIVIKGVVSAPRDVSA